MQKIKVGKAYYNTPLCECVSGDTSRAEDHIACVAAQNAVTQWLDAHENRPTVVRVAHTERNAAQIAESRAEYNEELAARNAAQIAVRQWRDSCKFPVTPAKTEENQDVETLAGRIARFATFADSDLPRMDMTLRALAHETISAMRKDPELAPFLLVGKGPNGSLRHVSVSAVASALDGIPETYEEMVQLLQRASAIEIVDGVAYRLHSRRMPDKEQIPEQKRDKTAYLTRGFHLHRCTRVCSPGCRNVGKLLYGSSPRGVPASGSEMYDGSQLIRPGDPAVPGLIARAHEAASADRRDKRQQFQEVSGKNVMVRTISGKISGVVSLRPDGIEVATGENVVKLAFCDLISWEKSHRTKRNEKKMAKKQEFSRGRWGKHGTTYHY